jgi:hypothetical protein
MALNPSISLGYRGVELPNQLAQLGQMAQLESAQNQNQVSQMQLAQMRREDETLKKIQATAMQNGGPSDLGKIADAYLQSGIPKFVEFGVGLREKLDKRARFARIMSMGEPPAAAPAAAPVANALTAPMQAGALGSGTFGIAPEPVANRLAAPAAAAAPAGPDVQILRARRNAFLAEGDIDAARAMDADIALASREPTYHNVAGVGLVDPRNARVVMPSVEKPPAPPSMVAEYTFAKTPDGGNFKGSFQDFVTARAAASRAPRPEAAPRTQQVTMSDGTLGIMNMDTGAVTPSTMGGVPVKGKDASKTAVSEQQASYNLGRVLTAASQINEIGKKDPGAVKPGGGEALAASLGMGGTANLARNANRQIVFGAQRDALDALLYLATGAAYNKEQLEGQMAAYIPSFTDKPENVAAKKARMTELIKSAKTRAGKAWTPEMDVAMNALAVPTAEPAPGASQGTGGFKYLGKESTK